MTIREGPVLNPSVRAAFIVLSVFSSFSATIISCGDRQTTLGVFIRKGGGIHGEQIAVEQFPKRADGVDEWLELTGEALRKLRSDLSRPGPVVLVLPSQFTLTKQVELPRVGRTQREKMIRFEATRALPLELSEVVWDHTPIGETATGTVFLLAAAKRAVIDKFCTAAQTAGLEIQCIQPSVLAVLGAYRLAKLTGSGPVLGLDIRERSTSLLQLDGLNQAVRTLPFGHEGNSPESLGNRLAQEVIRSALHFARAYGLAHPARLEHLAQNDHLMAATDAMAERLKIPVERIDVTRNLEILSGCEPSRDTFPDLIGAAAIELRRGLPAINLLPPELKEVKRKRSRRISLQASVLLALAALLPPWMHYQQVNRLMRNNGAALEEGLGPMRARSLQIRNQLEQLAQSHREADRLHSLLDHRSNWLRFLADLQRRLQKVDGVSLERMQAIPFNPDSSLRLRVAGRMLASGTSVPLERVKLLLDALVSSPFISSVEGERFDPTQPGWIHFEATLVADAAQLP